MTLFELRLNRSNDRDLPRPTLDKLPRHDKVATRRKPHSTPSHGINLRPDQKEVWVVDGVYGYVYVYDVTQLPPPQITSIPLFDDPQKQPHPGWITFSIDGRYAYPEGDCVIDTASKKVVAHIRLSEKLIGIDFDEAGKPVRSGHR